MSISQGILTALFCMVVVFAVLVILWAVIRSFSALIRLIERKNSNLQDNSK
ncbi:MAG: hypothetical protein K0R90_240 [Oscillospiraceae bacterium]|jgi:Na+-transporting methylmalonyl-CoA/oxaloacetate decarboxylase gamma subunit|nr:hypothetical protein [Oscillospiraceae bacterium]